MSQLNRYWCELTEIYERDYFGTGLHRELRKAIKCTNSCSSRIGQTMFFSLILLCIWGPCVHIAQAI